MGIGSKHVISWRRDYTILSLILAAISCANSCRTGRSAHDQGIIPTAETWSTSKWQGNITAASESWMDDFNDPVLMGLVEETLQQNFDLKAMSARMTAAYGTYLEERADLLPAFAGSFLASRRKRTATSGFQITNPRVDNFELILNTSWELDLWGINRASRRAAYRDYQAETAAFESAKLSLVATLLKSWYNAVEAKLQVNLTQKTVENFEFTQSIVAQGFRQGLNSAFDVRLANANTFNAKNSLAEERLRYDSAIRLLEVILGRYPGGEIETSELLPTITSTIPAGLPSDLLLRRPDLIEARHRLMAAEERELAEKRNFLPVITLTGSGGTSSAMLKQALNSNFTIWTIAAGLAQPIFEGGRLKGRRQAQSARREEAFAEYAQAVLTAFREVEIALASEEFITTQMQRVKSAEAELTAAEALALERYRKGLESIITLLETQRRSVDAQRLSISLMKLKVQNRIDLYLALGGDFLGVMTTTDNNDRTNSAYAESDH